MELALEVLMNNDLYYQENLWPLSFALAIAAGLLWLTDRKFSEKPALVLIDKETGEEVTVRKQHDFFFLKFTY
ncbi:MAG: hypothetical protein L0Y80_05675 [Ignavibacteriae bacterium]|nr:hypothetical protein [Ignavibacteriota bacterium]